MAKKTITGTVTDGMGEPLIGVVLRIEGTTREAATNIDGNYELNSVEASDQIGAYYDTYGTVIKPVGAGHVLDFILSEEPMMDE